jgi:hypothetical protein
MDNAILADPAMPTLADISRAKWPVTLVNAWTTANTTMLLQLELPHDAVTLFGGAAELLLNITLPVPTSDMGEDVVEVTLTWRNKTATRLAESSWLSFDPVVGSGTKAGVTNWRLDVLGHPVDPLNVAFNGTRRYHAVHRGVCYDDTQDYQPVSSDGAAADGAGAGRRLAIESLDTPFVAPGDIEHLLNFDNKLPELEHGFHYNLHNNAAWDGSSPWWCDQDGVFRFRLRLNPPLPGCWGSTPSPSPPSPPPSPKPPQPTPPPGPASAKPNFLLLFLDDHGWGDMGANVNTTTETPNMDRLAHSGIRFLDFHVGFSVCTPSRAALLTARLCPRTGVCKNFNPTSRYGMALTERTIADVLNSGGYESHMIGKWVRSLHIHSETCQQ